MRVIIIAFESETSVSPSYSIADVGEESKKEQLFLLERNRTTVFRKEAISSFAGYDLDSLLQDEWQRG